MSATENSISLPTELLPGDGRFGSGPSKVRVEALQAFFDAAPRYLGTSPVSYTHLTLPTKA